MEEIKKGKKKLTKYKILKDEEIQKVYELIRNMWEKYLKDKGVKLPKLKKDGKYTRDALVLVYLAQNYPSTKPISKTELTQFIRRWYPDTTDVQQARHLARQKGWYIISSTRGNYLEVEIPKDSYLLVSLEEPYPGWTPHRKVGISDEDFEKLKQIYNYRCATCGSEEDKPNLKNPKRITKLQRAHIDPKDESKGYIPQCEECNRAYRDWFVFDKLGRVITIANPRVVLRASEEVQKQVYKILKLKYKGK